MSYCILGTNERSFEVALPGWSWGGGGLPFFNFVVVREASRVFIFERLYLLKRSRRERAF